MPLSSNQANSDNELNTLQSLASAFKETYTNQELSRIGETGKANLIDLFLVADAAVSDKNGTVSTRVELAARSEQLRKMVNEVDNPFLKPLLKEMQRTMSTWLTDSEVACCIIRELFNIFLANSARRKIYSAQLSFNEGVVNFTQDWNEFLTDANNIAQDFNNFLAGLESILNTLIAIYNMKIDRKYTISFNDIIKELMTFVYGALILLAGASDYLIQKWINDNIKSLINENDMNVFAKCLQLDDLIYRLKRYLKNPGLIQFLTVKLLGWLSGLKSDWQKSIHVVRDSTDLEYLKWFRILIGNMRLGIVNFDLCVDYDYVASTQLKDIGRLGNNIDSSVVTAFVNNSITSAQEAKDRQGTAVASDGTILLDDNKIRGKGTVIPTISNTSVRNFMNKYYGIPTEVVDNILSRASSADSIIGTDINSDRTSDLSNDCPNITTADELVAWTNNIRSRLK